MFNFRLFFHCLLCAFRVKKDSEFRISAKRIIILFLFFILYSLSALINWFFGLLDNVFFLSHKKTEILNPVFITGAPRSGTTFIHRSLARDKQNFTSFTLGEILFAPSLMQKFIFYLISLIDNRLKSPVKSTLIWIEKRLASDYGKIHEYSLFEPDEDEILMTGIFSSLYLLFLFPETERIKKYSQFDELLTISEKAKIMKYYVRLIRKHLYFNKRFKKSSACYLAKSPAYIAKLDAFYETFPGCKIIYTERNPLEVLPSWISMNSNVFKKFNSPKYEYTMVLDTIELLATWLQKASEKLTAKDSDTYYIVDYNVLNNNPGMVIRDIYTHFNFELTCNYLQVIDAIGQDQKKYTSRHKYALEKMGLKIESLQKKFSGLLKITR